jgi:acyl-CoA synthetase (AMP-forming)/AMP-acid ligase II
MSGIGALTMGGFVQEIGERFAANEAIVFDDPLRDGEVVRWNYAALRNHARWVGNALIALDVAPGDRVGILMGNRPEAISSLLGTAMVGAVAVPMSTFAPVSELAYMIETASASVVLTQSRLLSRHFGKEVVELRAEVPGLRHVAVLGEDVPPTAVGWTDFLAAGDTVGASALAERMDATTPEDEALVIFTSGTTSRPKGILHAHRAPSLQFWAQAQIFGRSRRTRMWTALPWFWTAGLNTAVGSTLAAGGCWVAQETFDPGDALHLMQRERVTEPYSLPHQTKAMEEHPDWATADLSSLRCVYGKSAFARHPSVNGDTSWFMPVGYGLSETCAYFVTHWWNTPREVQRESTGRLLPGNELRILDPESGRELDAGDEGEMAIKGPTLMLRYLGRSPEECFDTDGFLHTGDAGSVDADGFVHFSGRNTEMIKTGGANVSPAELEVQLRACPPVKLARIVGVPDPVLDQIVVACITLKEGAEATDADIRDFLRSRVAAYKVPKRVLFFDDGEIPMTSSDTKVRDDALLDLVADRLAAEQVPAGGTQR